MSGPLQLASCDWHHRCLAVLEAHGIPWTGTWDLSPTSYAPDTIYTLALSGLGHIGRGSYGTVH